jgi:immunity protein 53 of polymorphic toxin system
MDKALDEIAQIQNWYLGQCNGDWEHEYGLQIGTLDNPGWSVQIDLADTELETKPFSPVEKGIGAESFEDDQDWYSCKVENKKFVCACGPLHLRTALRVFLDWSIITSR